MKTNTSKQKVTVKEFGNGKPYLAFELLEGDEIPSLIDANVGFYLKEGTSYEEAEELARAINSKLSSMYVTTV